jgi:hypothetical protein
LPCLPRLPVPAYPAKKTAGRRLLGRQTGGGAGRAKEIKRKKVIAECLLWLCLHQQTCLATAQIKLLSSRLFVQVVLLEAAAVATPCRVEPDLPYQYLKSIVDSFWILPTTFLVDFAHHFIEICVIFEYTESFKPRISF